MSLRQIVSRARGTEVSYSYQDRHIHLTVSPLLSDDSHDGTTSTDPKLDSEDGPVFKHRCVPSTIELFYDLFFVANLATFTENHDVYSSSTFRSYLGFFSLLWATWFQTALYDVRFGYDSIFLRVSKGIHIGVEMGFISAGAVYSTDPEEVSLGGFRRLAIIQMISRLCLMMQYGSVFWYVRKYQRTWTPLLATMGILFAAAMVYLGTYFGFNDTTSKTYYAWYVVAPIEVVLTVIVSSIWRVMSFKDTYIVERFGLLTLIIIGEGILGLSKSVSNLLKATVTQTSLDAGVLVASTVLIYLIWMLYFDQVQNERFGTVKQQLWMLFHYPLHLCILFTVEGSTNLFAWVTTSPYYISWVKLCPPITHINQFYAEYPTVDSLVSYMNSTINDLDAKFKTDYEPTQYYPTYLDSLNSLQNRTAEYGTPLYLNQTYGTIFSIWQGIGNGIYQTVKIEIDTVNPVKDGVGPALKEASDFYVLIERFVVVFYYFYLAAGLFLISLSILYILGNKRKSLVEYLALGFRTLAGVGIMMGLVGLLYQQNFHVFLTYFVGPWHVVIVMLVYLIVIIVDNLFVEHEVRKERREMINGNAEDMQPGVIKDPNNGMTSDSDYQTH